MIYTDGYGVAAFLGQADDPALVALAGEHVEIVTAMARSYTRGRGFDTTTGDPRDDVAAVIIVATARMMTNPGGLPYTVGETTVRGSFTGWSLAELIVLNRHRRRAA